MRRGVYRQSETPLAMPLLYMYMYTQYLYNVHVYGHVHVHVHVRTVYVCMWCVSLVPRLPFVCVCVQLLILEPGNLVQRSSLVIIALLSPHFATNLPLVNGDMGHCGSMA